MDDGLCCIIYAGGSGGGEPNGRPRPFARPASFHVPSNARLGWGWRISAWACFVATAGLLVRPALCNSLLLSPSCSIRGALPSHDTYVAQQKGWQKFTHTPCPSVSCAPSLFPSRCLCVRFFVHIFCEPGSPRALLRGTLTASATPSVNSPCLPALRFELGTPGCPVRSTRTPGLPKLPRDPDSTLDRLPSPDQGVYTTRPP